MAQLYDGWVAIQDFLNSGGNVLYLIMAVLVVLWTLILERLWYFRFVYPGEVRQVVEEWHRRRDRSSWRAHKIREMLVSRLHGNLLRSVGMIKTLVAVCPLLGLLGTVTGMIEVFEVMSIVGNTNPRPMASGVTRATIPTMAGMVAALSGYFFAATMRRYVDREAERAGDLLTRE